VLDVMRLAGAKTLRIFISYAPANQKGSGGFNMEEYIGCIPHFCLLICREHRNA
jgi:hypothetical protein